MIPRLRRDLFTLLNAVTGFSVAEKRLISSLGDTWTASEVTGEIRRMERDGFVTSGRNALDEINWRLTSNGQAAAAELGV